ncbi:MAG: Gldg family protein [Chloroflexota bacterium]|nr:Gldg family protein [Chloroflexota bacterium]
MARNTKSNNIRPPLVITRGQIANIASFIGVAALLAGIVGALWTGRIDTPILITLGVGAAGIVLWVLATPGEFIGFVTGRKVRYGTFAAFSTLLLIAVTAMVFLSLGRASITLDMTTNRLFSLGDASKNVITRVTRPIQITGFYSARNLPQRELDDQFFRLYSAANRLITRVYIDPDEQPALADRYGVNDDGQVFISYLNDAGIVDFNTLARVPLSDRQERDMTGAISRLLIAGSISVYFNMGLGERDPRDTSQAGISGINGGMRETGFITNLISLPELAAQNADIPADAAALLFVRPTIDIDAAQIAVLDRYLARGGTLLLLIDPTFNETPFMQSGGAFDTYLRANYGLYARNAIVVDGAASGQSELDVIGANVNTATDISARLIPVENPLLFSVARAVEVDIDRAIPDVANGRLVTSSDLSYGETDWVALSQTNQYQWDEGVDIAGPLTTVAWASNQSTGARIVLVGDSDFVSNGAVTIGGNGILFTDAMTWLTNFADRLDFGTRGFSVSLPLIFVASQTLDLIAFGTIIVMPTLVLLTGFILWTRRARRR